eukprot:3049610-Prymnesium_polylepis.1
MAPPLPNEMIGPIAERFRQHAFVARVAQARGTLRIESGSVAVGPLVAHRILHSTPVPPADVPVEFVLHCQRRRLEHISQPSHICLAIGVLERRRCKFAASFLARRVAAGLRWQVGGAHDKQLLLHVHACGLM